MATTIVQLSQLISASVSQLVDACAAQDLELPELNDTFTLKSEAFRKHPTAAQAVNNIAAAAFQLIACVLSPRESTWQVASGHNKSAALRVAVECHIPEILREAGEQGLHADDIAKKAGIDGSKLARLLRILVNRHIFREIRENVFTNNRLSSSLDTGKPYEHILSNPEAKHDGTPGTTALVEFMSDEVHKGSAYLLESMKDPITTRSVEPQHAALPRSLGLNKSFYEWHAEPGQEYRPRRFSSAMTAWATDPLLELFDWGKLPNDALLVDVGGGFGSLARLVSNAYPKLNFVVQDTPPVIENAKHYWNEKDPEAIKSGRIRLQAHDFFSPQPISNASLFMVKNVLHNWSDENVLKILTHLRNAAAADTTLLILADIAVPSTLDLTEFGFEVEPVTEDQAYILNPPTILSTGYTAVNDRTWMVDVATMILLNGQRHTLHQVSWFLRSTGWDVTKVVLSGGFTDSVQAKPV